MNKSPIKTFKVITPILLIIIFIGYSQDTVKNRLSLNDANSFANIIQEYDQSSKITKSNTKLTRLNESLYKIHKGLNEPKLKAFLVPGDSKSDVDLSDIELLKSLEELHPDNSCLILQNNEKYTRGNKISLNDVYPGFEKVLKNIDLWPGVLFWDEDESLFYPIESENQIIEIFEKLKIESNGIKFLKEKLNTQDDDVYFIHLSDLHLGDKDSDFNTKRLLQLIENEFKSKEGNPRMIPIITGDLVENPNIENNVKFDDFKDQLRRIGLDEPIYVFGNHDYYTTGWTWKKFLKYFESLPFFYLQERIKIIEDLKLVFIKIDSNHGATVSQGKIGKLQLSRISTQLDQVPNLDDYQIIVLLHHHIKKLELPDDSSLPFYKKFIGEDIFKRVLALEDADLLIDWLDAKNIRFVLHGHKHIPLLFESNKINIISAGSSTGINRKILTYNLIKYSKNNSKLINSTIIAEDLGGYNKRYLQTKEYLYDEAIPLRPIEDNGQLKQTQWK
ncbi:metallophosphoesterase family protein [Candidatus Neomarinimicrobiota bacterium]